MVEGLRSRSTLKIISQGNEHYRKGELAESVKCYNQAIQLEPDNPIAWNNKGLILAIAGKYEEALACHAKAVEVDPNYVDAISNMGMVYSKMDKLDDALLYYNKALEKIPNHEIAWNNKGNLLAKMERHDEAMQCYDKALELNPNYLAAMNNKAVELNHLKRFDEAIRILDRVLKERPTFAEGWYVKGKSFIGKGDFEKAIVCLERSYRLDPEFHQAKRALDILRQKLVEPPGKKVQPEKKKAYEKPHDMEKIKEKIEQDIMEVGAELDILGDEFKTDEHLTKDELMVFENIGDEPIPGSALRKSMGGRLSPAAIERGLEGLERKGLITSKKAGRGTLYERTEALGAIEEEVVDKPVHKEEEKKTESVLGDFHTLVSQGRKLADDGRYKEALSNFRRALIINPYDEMAICLKAQMYYELDDREKAINTISDILKNKPDFIPAWFTLANVTMKHKEYKDATDCFRKILDIQPYNQEAKKGLDKCMAEMGPT